MKYFALLIALCAMFVIGSTAMAADFPSTSDTATVTLDIEQYCTLDITLPTIAIVKTGEPGAYEGISGITGNANFDWKLAATLEDSTLPGGDAAITAGGSGVPGAIAATVTVSGTTGWTDDADGNYGATVRVTVSPAA